MCNRLLSICLIISPGLISYLITLFRLLYDDNEYVNHQAILMYVYIRLWLCCIFQWPNKCLMSYVSHILWCSRPYM